MGYGSMCKRSSWMRSARLHEGKGDQGSPPVETEFWSCIVCYSGLDLVSKILQHRTLSFSLAFILFPVCLGRGRVIS
jgi:hypothetical protein